jgi:DNA replication protein DnaC
MVEQIIPCCEFCGAPYVEITEEVRRFLPEAIRDKVRFRPTCDCLEREKQKAVLEEIERRQKEAHKEALEEAFKRACLSKRFRRRTLQSYIAADEKQSRALSAFLHLAEHFKEAREEELNGIYLFGAPTRGKTHLAAGLVNALLRQGVFCIYAKCAELPPSLRAHFRDGEKEKVITPLLEAELLVLDDLGAEERRDWFFDDLYRILDHRMEWLLPTVITSNLSPAEVCARYGKRIASRIERMCKILEV